MASIQKPSIPKGTRDFTPIEMERRNYIFSTIKSVFKRYGYKQIETPSIENLSTLLGKYGEEGDKLLFKVLNSGDAFSNVSSEELSNSNALSLKVCEKGLRYDLTVPFARFVVQHRNELVFPFKRFQIQPVWRADRPQKGRYREFYQCDVDVVGAQSLLNEVELIQIVDDVFAALGIGVTIKINNRKILQALSQVMGYPDKIIPITVAIDKIDKIGFEAVVQEMKKEGISDNAIDIIKPILTFVGDSNDKLNLVKDILKDNEIGQLGIQELEYVLEMLGNLSLTQKVEIDLSLARGLNYYTGAIFEVKANDYSIGSICGGGRYDNLTGIFGMPDVSGVGISFGADRIYDVLLGINKFPANLAVTTQVLFANMSKEGVKFALPIMQKLRSQGVSCELFVEESKLRKQFEYGQKNNIPYIAIIAENEINNNFVTIKNIETGEQNQVNIEKISAFFGL